MRRKLECGCGLRFGLEKVQHHYWKLPKNPRGFEVPASGRAVYRPRRQRPDLSATVWPTWSTTGLSPADPVGTRPSVSRTRRSKSPSRSGMCTSEPSPGGFSRCPLPARIDQSDSWLIPTPQWAHPPVTGDLIPQLAFNLGRQIAPPAIVKRSDQLFVKRLAHPDGDAEGIQPGWVYRVRFKCAGLVQKA